MNKKLAYKILGLTEGASEQEIRRRYKRQAMKVHPDINPDKNAHEEFILLSLAVEFLLKPQEEQIASRTSRATSKKANASGPATTSAEEQAERMKEAKTRYDEQRKKNAEENRRYFHSLLSGKRWVIYRTVMCVGIILACSILLDNLLPQHIEEDEIASFSSGTHNGILEDRICLIEFKNVGSCFVRSNYVAYATVYPQVTVVKSWLLHNPISFYSTDDFTNYNTRFDFDMHSIQWFMALLFLIPLYPYFFRRMSTKFVFFYQFSFWFVGLVELVVLTSHNRFIHLLALGFL